jgi:hypothetical protein
MEKTEVIVVSLVFGVVAFRLYQKYFKKYHRKPGNGSRDGSSFASSKDDDYEPYSKK